MPTLCVRCGQNRAHYNVIAPICLGSANAPMCPSCFQDGLDHGEIVWLGAKPYGICADHEKVA